MDGTAQLWASAPGDPRARRAIDAIRAVLAALALLTTTVLSQLGADLDAQLSGALLDFPGFLRVVWVLAFWAAIVWAAALLVAAAVRSRWRLVLEVVVAVVAALGIALVCAGVVGAEMWDVVGRFADVDGPATFLPGAIVVSTAVVTTIAPFVTLPIRRFGRSLIAAQAAGSLFLGASLAFGTLAALSIGLLAGALVHLVAGSPGGLPTRSRVQATLAGLGIAVDDLSPTGFTREGVALFGGTHGGHRVVVKVYGRDAWEGELLADLWRLAWFRGVQRRARLRRRQYVEHEGFVTFLAGDAGVDVPKIVTAGRADNGDAVIVTRPNGSRLDLEHPALSAAQVRELWLQLERLHRAGIVHHRIDLDRVVLRDDGVGFADLSTADVRAGATEELVDRAQLLTLSIVAAGIEVARDEAVAVLGADRVAPVLPYLQDAAMPPHLRGRLRRDHLELDHVREELAATVGTNDVELVRLRRVGWKSLLNLVLLAVAATTLIGLVSGIDLAAFGRELRNADVWWIVAALGIAQLPRAANALSTLGSSVQPLPFGPTVALHVSTGFVNLAVPSSAGRVAVTTRYFQRFGIPPATALSAGVIDSVSELAVQVALFTAILFVADVDLGVSFDTDQLAGLGSVALAVVVAAAVVGLLALAVPAVRTRVRTWIHDAAEAVQVLRNPQRLLQLFGGNLLAQLLFAVALGACANAFGADVPLSSLILINTVVSLFAGLLPVPGGVGVAEAGIALGLSRVGLPPATAFAVALTYRFCTFYLPPLWGLQAYRWMTRHHYL
jgi:uncharacterized membrane protein YbhN (UPF0104 family)